MHTQRVWKPAANINFCGHPWQYILYISYTYVADSDVRCYSCVCIMCDYMSVDLMVRSALDETHKLLVFNIVMELKLFGIVFFFFVCWLVGVSSLPSSPRSSVCYLMVLRDSVLCNVYNIHVYTAGMDG